MSSCGTDVMQGLVSTVASLQWHSAVPLAESPGQAERHLDTMVAVAGTLTKMAQQSCLQDVVVVLD